MSNEKQALSPENLLQNYSDTIQAGLENGLQYVESFNTLTHTEDIEELIDSAIALTNYQLDSQFVNFPHQYNDEDITVIFFKRFLELAKIKSGFTITPKKNIQKILARFIQLGEEKFTFVKSAKNNNGFFFNSLSNNQPLFYLNLKNKEVLFNGPALIQLFVVDYEGLKPKMIKDTLAILISAAKVLKRQFGFTVDFNVLDTINGEFYAFSAGEIPREILDELFVAAADNNYILMAGQGDGAHLTLSNGIELDVFDAGEYDTPIWGATIHDENQTEGWLDLLLDYPFIKDWYLTNIRQLGIIADKVVFE